jgi:hypothetical protein
VIVYISLEKKSNASRTTSYLLLQSVSGVVFPALLFEDVSLLQNLFLERFSICFHLNGEFGYRSAEDSDGEKSGVCRIVNT